MTLGGTRDPILAGSWYPGDPRTLSSQVDGFLAAAASVETPPQGRPLIAVAPHAGYVYSGPTAGRIFGLLAGSAVKTVFILAPSHRAHIRRIALTDSEAFATPLGEMTVATDLNSALAENSTYALDPAAHASEHAVEIQLPFLQRVWPVDPPRIVPMLVPHMDPQDRRQAAAALVKVAGPDSLLLVSTDFTHYGQSYGYMPFAQDIPEALERLDTGAILRILAGDPEGLIQYGRETDITMCGLSATALALTCGLPEGYEAALIDYRRSGDENMDYSLSVSYAAILMCARPDHHDRLDQGTST